MSQQKYSEAYSFAGGRNGYNFGEPERMKSSKLYPGPGNYYKIDMKYTVSKTTTYSFGKQPRMQSSKTTIPGPGAYAHEKTEVHKHKMPVFSLGKSDRSMDIFATVGGSQFFQSSQGKFRASSPGPGHYQLDAVINKTKPRVSSAAAENSARGIDFRNENLKTPGPGAYMHDSGKLKNKNPTYSLSKQNRNDPFMIVKQKQNLPGPGVYNVNTTIGNGQKSMLRGKPKFNADNGVPGPGAYTEKKSEVSKSGGWKMIKARDDSFFISKGSINLPGPGVYSNSTIFDPKKMNGFTFGEKQKLNNNKGNPGPADYAPKYTHMGTVAPYCKMKTTAY